MFWFGNWMTAEISFKLAFQLGIHKYRSCMSAFCLLGLQSDFISYRACGIHHIAIAQARHLPDSQAC